MALYLFPVPQVVRQQRALEEQPIMSLWTRVKRDIPSTIIRDSDGVTWEEWVGSYPQLLNPRSSLLFGGSGFNTMGSDQSAWAGCSRLYLGGHQYVIDDILAAELIEAETTYASHPLGYSAYIVAAPPGSVFTGDEIILSGRSSDVPRKLTST